MCEKVKVNIDGHNWELWLEKTTDGDGVFLRGLHEDDPFEWFLMRLNKDGIYRAFGMAHKGFETVEPFEVMEVTP